MGNSGPARDYPFERYRAVSGKHEYRIFYGPEAATQARPWILAVREIGETATARLPDRTAHSKLCLK
jgi:hypothetical protein